MLVLNTGGTFNKRYNPITGELEVPMDNYALERMMVDFTQKPPLSGVVYKDSLEIDIADRKMIADIIFHSSEKEFVLIHGTDTMEITAEFLSEIFEDRVIVLTGAMKPFEVDEVEASLNYGMALGFAMGCKENGVYICMNGYVKPWDQIRKNKALGRFEVE